ncbi:uncharacterized protein LOC117123790 [Anneissia japonica]|uniref:uncharacterized protein LOC117123790 n=1 Tax=Anneissia japonica TaxID=1529436 RepID=UPI0014258B99|nr:uncharacterized protein LOC117123790 [Anneissia japonica]
MFEENWIYGKFCLTNLIIPTQESRKVIIVFSENPKNENGILAAYKVVSDATRDMKLKQGKLISVKLTPNAIIPDAVDLFTTAEAWDQRFIERLLESLDDTEPQHLISSDEDALQPCFEAIKLHYCQTRNQIQLLPFDRSNIVNMDTLFTNLVMVIELLNPTEKFKVPLDSYHDIFKRPGSDTPVNRVLVYGKAGIGKSTLINKIAYDWASENKESPITNFKLVIALSMQTISSNEDIVEAMFEHGILTEEYMEYKAHLHRFIRHHSNKVAVLLDACDEYKPVSIESPDNGEILKLLENKYLRSSFVCVTSRPWRIDEFKKHRGTYLHCELQGFSEKDVAYYVNQFFLRDADKERSLIAYLRNNGLISGIATLPMMTMFLCWLWKDNVLVNPPETISELYDEILDYIFNRYEDKDKDNVKQIEMYQVEVLKRLSIVGLEGLFTNNLKFREEEINKNTTISENAPPNTVTRIACKIGLLMKDTEPGNVQYSYLKDKDTDSDNKQTFHRKRRKMTQEVLVLFFHKTAQEKCAAQFAATLVHDDPEQFRSYMGKICSVKDALQFEMFLLFLSGTNTDSATLVLNKLLEIFVNELSSNSDRYLNGKLSFEESMAFQQYTELCIRCYHESKCSGSLNDIMTLIFKQGHMRFSNFSTTLAKSLSYLLKFSQMFTNVNLNIFKIELMNICIKTNKEISTLWEMFPVDETEFTEKVKIYSLMPKEEIDEHMRECQMEKLPPVFHQFPANQRLSFLRTYQITDDHRSNDTDVKPIFESLQRVNIREFTFLGFDLATMTDFLPYAISKSSLTVLNLTSANVGPEVCRVVAMSFKKTHNLRQLILKNNPLQDGIGFLAENFQYIDKLTHLNVSYCPVSESGMITLSQNLHILKLLQVLSIYRLFDKASEKFGQGIQGMNCLQELTLPLQGVSIPTAYIIVQQACQCHQLVVLKITDMTENCDNIVSCAAENLTDMPYLKILSLYGKRDEGEIEVIKKNCTLTNGTCDALVKMLQRIVSLKRLQIVSLWMSNEGLRKVADLCENHCNLMIFRYSGECLPSGMEIENFKKIQLY